MLRALATRVFSHHSQQLIRMDTILFSLATLALSGSLAGSPSADLKPLPEERQLAEPEQVALEFAKVTAGELGILGWTKTTIRRGKIEEEVHYLVHRVAELADFGTLGFSTMESRGVYNSSFELVHEMQVKTPLGSKGKPLELEWSDESFRWREGRGKWTVGTDKTRPTSESDIPLMVHGLSTPVPFEARVFEAKTKLLNTQTMQAGKKSTVDESTRVIFGVEGPEPMSHELDLDGVYMASDIGELRVIGVDPVEDVEETLRRSLANNATFEKLMDQKLPTLWNEKSGTYTHSSLGMSLKLPKGWKRSKKTEADGIHFHALSEDSNAYVSFATTALGTGYTLESWSEGLLEVYSSDAVGGKVKTKKKSFAKQDAVSFEYVSTGDAPLDSQAYAWSRNGIGYLLVGGTWSESPTRLHKETASIFKSVKIER